MAPKVYQGRGETAQKIDVPRKKIDAQNSTQAGVLKSIISDYFSVDYLEGVQEYPAQILKVLKERAEFKNFRETSTSFIGEMLTKAAERLGAGEKRYIVRVFSVDVGIPAPDDFGNPDGSSANTINDAVIQMHSHHEMVPSDSSDTYEVGDPVIIKFNNNYDRTDGVILRKAGDAPKKDESPSPNNPENYPNPSGEFSDPSGGTGTVGCATPAQPNQSAAQSGAKPSEAIKIELENLQKQILELEAQVLEYDLKIKTISSINEDKRTPEQQNTLVNYNKEFDDLQSDLEDAKQQYQELAKSLNSIVLQKQEIKVKIEVANRKLQETRLKIDNIKTNINNTGGVLFDTDEEKILIINLKGSLAFEENQLKVLNDTLVKLLLEQKKIDAIPVVDTQQAPPPPPAPCSPGAASNNGKKQRYPKSVTPEQRLILIRAVVKGCRSMGFTNTNFIAAVCANIEKETGWVIRPEYDYGGTPAKRLRDIFGKRLAQFNDQDLEALARRNEEFYDYIYGYKTPVRKVRVKDKNGKDLKDKKGNFIEQEISLGITFENKDPGDGYKYRGRGFIGYTGKGLYRKASQAIFKDDRLVKNPDLANEPEINGKFLAYYLSTTVKRWEKVFNVSSNSEQLTKRQACALVTSMVGGTNILVSVENEKKANKTIKDGIWIQIFTKVETFFDKYLEEAAKK